jgi:hypothetical protein
MLTDETATVREVALISIVGIAVELGARHLEDCILPIIHRLANNITEVHFLESKWAYSI